MRMPARSASTFLLLLSLAGSANAVTKIWTGLGATWTNISSWTPTGSAAAGDDLIFPSVTGITNSTNDVAPDTTFAPINITGNTAPYTFNGNRIVAGGDILSSSTIPHTWNIPILLGGTRTFIFTGQFNGGVDLNGSNLALATTGAGPFFLNGVLTNSGSLTINSAPHPVVITNPGNSYLGGTFVQSGAKLEVAGSGVLPGTTTADGRLSGNNGPGSAGAVVNINAGGVLAAGPANGNSIGILSMNTLNMMGTLEAQIAPGPSSDIVRATSVNISSATLTVMMPPAGFTPGQTFLIVDNLGAGAVAGTFNGLPENQILTVNDNKLRINYAIGTGNDVGLLVLNPARHWTGNGTDPLWSNPTNWAENSAPVSGSIVIFPAGVANKVTNNDILSIQIESMRFDEPGYSVTGQPIQLQNGINAGVGGTTISAPLVLLNPQSWNYGGTLSGSISLGSFNLTINATQNISATGAIAGTAAATLFLNSGNVSRVFVTNVQPRINVQGSARLVLDPGAVVSGVTVIAGGAAVAGAGAFTGNLSVSSFLSPGSPDMPTPGVFDLIGAPPGGPRLNLPSGQFLAEMAGPAPGQYDRVNVTGSVSIGAMTFAPNLMFPAAPLTQFTIIDNDLNDPIVGAFPGFPEGTLFSAGGQPMRITYIGGTGNDVVLTRVSNPTIASIVPNSGPTQGGTSVTISGNEFLPGATVTVAGTPAAITSVSFTSITFTTPAGVSGPATVAVTNPDGQQVFGVFTYDAPSIASINPASGGIGTVITIDGSSLNSVDSVTIGGVSAAFTVVSATQIQATVPAGTPPGNVVVTAASNGFVSNAFPFQRISNPTITNVSPPNGPTTGGISVTVSGTEFLPGASVTVGGASAAIVSASPTSITFTLPAGTSGPATVTVTNPDGQFVNDTFTYDSPSLTSLSPVSGGIGTIITIDGASLNSVTSVTIGGVSAPFSILSGTQIQATVPTVPPGGQPVIATSGAFSSNALTFTRISSPTITNITPNSGTTAGGISVTIDGTDFVSGAIVTVGPAVATVTSVSPTSIVFTLPVGVSGPVSVVVTNPDAQSASTTFTYDSPSIANVTPASGVTGTTVTITGASLNAVQSVTFGGAGATFTILSATQIQATVPAGAPGPANLVVTSNGFSSAAASFTRVSSPTISGISPPSGPTGGGITVTVSGTDFVAGATVTVGGASAPATVTSPTMLTFTLPAGSSGPKPVVVTNPDGQTASGTFTYDSPAIANVAPASGNVGATITINGTSLSAVTSVTFNGVSATFTVVSDTQLQVVVPNVPPGNATIIVGSGAFSSSPTAFTVTCPSLTVAISGATNACDGESVMLTATPSSTPVTYLWSNGATTQSINVSGIVPAATYSVTVTSPTGCTATASHTINAAPRGVLNIDAPAIVTAGNTATASIMNPPAGASTYTWVVTNGDVVSGQGTSSLTFRAGPSGSVTLSVEAPLTTCSASGSISIPIQQCATAPATLIAPADGVTVQSPVEFRWAPVQNAVSYELWIGADAASAVLTAATTATTLTRSLPSGDAVWFVVTRLAAGCSPDALQSAANAFTIEPVNNCPVAGPVAVSPSGSTHVFSPITFEWSGVEDATGYSITVRSSAGDIIDLGSVSDDITQITAELPPGDYTWTVAAIYDGCPAVGSTGAAFIVDREDCTTHTAPILVSPADTATLASGSVTFSWTTVQGNDGYRVWTSNLSNGEEPAVLGETNDTTFSATLEPGTISWFIEALFKGCPSTFSATQTFVAPAAVNCGNNAAPSLIAPSGGVTLSDANVTFSWSNQGAVEYEIYLSVNSGTPALLGRTDSTTFTSLVPQGTLDWFVRALFEGCPALTSQTARFIYQPAAACSTDRPIPIAPQNESTPIPSPVKFRWSAVTGASGYRLTISSTTGARNIDLTDTEASVDVASGPAAWSVTALFAGSCPANDSAVSQFVVVATPSGCIDLAQPIIAAPSQISDNVPYFVQWQPVVGATSYLLQRSTTGAFDSVSGAAVDDTQASFTDRNSGTDALTLFYRVRAVSNRCTPVAAGPFSAIVGVIILPAVQSSDLSTEGSTLASQSGTITYSIQLGPELAGASFSATPTAPWITVTPSTGVIPATGIRLVVTANPEGLPVGTSAGNVIVTLDTPNAARAGLPRTSTGTNTVTVPVTVNKVTPVAPNPKSAPPPDALIIPAVAHADGINSKFESDVRITNTSAQVVKYQLTFTPTGEGGITDGRQAVVDIQPGRTMALDDVLKSWFGTGTSSALGTLEIRPLTKTAASTSSAAVKGLQNFSTFASSRTFNRTLSGTFGQYIPAVPFANFVGRSADASRPTILSMQQIAQSAAFRTNLGFIEGSGEPAQLLVSVFSKSGQKLTDFDVLLKGGQHLQMGNVLAQKGLTVDDGRIEVRVTSPTGKVSAYASVLDNKTSDSLLVTPVTLGDTGNTKFVLPGVAELSGGIPWQTDMRLFNASDNAVTATLTFRSQITSATQKVDVPLGPREVKQFDRVLSSLFGIANDGGALHITTPSAVNLIATARTYRPVGSGGSFGQFISAVTPNEAVGRGTRPLQILQVEESPRFRSNVGIAEVTGRPAVVEITVIPPDAKVVGTVRVPLEANQVRQFNSLLAQMGLKDVHNARVTVRVVEGDGRVTGYASVIDAQTADPTYVPAQ